MNQTTDQAPFSDPRGVRQELELAQQMQANLLPQSVPSLDGYQIAAQSRPGRYVSGDLYDFGPCSPASCHILLADISGHGVPAALLASALRTLVHLGASQERAPAALLDGVQRELQADLEHTDTFITVFAARLDARLGHLVYANAGHTEALWIRAGGKIRRHLPATGLPLGVLDTPGVQETPGELALRQESIYVRPGDLLVVYSDGITEAANPTGKPLPTPALTGAKH